MKPDKVKLVILKSNNIHNDSIGGIEIQTLLLSDYLEKKRYDIHIICLISNDWDIIIDKPEKFKIYRYKFINIKILGLIVNFLLIIYRIYKIKPSLIHVQTLGMATPAFITKILFNIPYIIQGHGELNIVSGRKSLIFSKLSLKNADNIIALSKDMAQKFNDIIPAATEIIPNGILLNGFLSVKKKKLNKRNILFIGRLEKEKGLDFLIIALKILINHDQNIQLIIVGDGKDKYYYFDLIKKYGLTKNVKYIGKIPHQKIASIYSIAEIFVLPSFFEGFPLTCIEAMACGLPVVATNVGGIPELIENEINGFLVEPGSSEKLAEKILYIYHNPMIIDKIGMNNRNKVLRYGSNLMGKRFELVYQEILSKYQ